MKSAEFVNEAIDIVFDWLSSIIGNIASNIAPLLAGILPAYLTWRHIQFTLGFPDWVAWAGAGVIEFIGLGAGTEFMRVWNHNRKYKDEKAKMPMLGPGAAALYYVLIMVAFNVILEASPNSMFWRITSIALFATLAIPGYALIAGKTLRKEWESERSRALSERRAERQRARGEHTEQGEQKRGALRDNPERSEHASKWEEQILSILERTWQAQGKVPGGAEIVSALNEGHGANLDRAKASGFISTLTKQWMQGKGIRNGQRQ
jgi:hypothetical protein